MTRIKDREAADLLDARSGAKAKRPRPRRLSPRMSLSIICTLLAVGYWAVRARTQQAVYLPASVISVHAMWQHDCRSCHAGSGGAFSASVTDEACLKCHTDDAAAHHPNQKHLISADRQQAAQCANCHVEHKDRPALTAQSDQFCTECHRDLPRNTTSTSVEAALASVTAFSPSGHPAFKPSLERGKPIHDPTRLQFNHFEHVTRHLKSKKKWEDCRSCHAPFTEKSLQALSSLPRQRIPSPKGEYLRLVSYEEHCKECHSMPTLGDIEMPHARLELVRSVLKTVDHSKLTEEKEEKSGRPRIGGGPPKKVPVQGLEALGIKLRKQVVPASAPEDTKKLLLAAPASDFATASELYVAKECSKCHELSLVNKQFDTIPTAILQVPRRWFHTSDFNHDKHQHMKCADCHAAVHNATVNSALTEPATRTAHVLVPGDSWPMAISKGKDQFAMETRACADCHRPDEGTKRFAGSNCVMCHNFHQRMKGPLPGPTSRPVVSAVSALR
jgi:hypothetical protein